MFADDETLVRRCRNGDAAAIRSLIERYQNDVFGMCVRLLHHQQDAEDVTQETFLRVIRSLHRWDGKRPLRPWILGIAVNRCRTTMTRRIRRPELVNHLEETTAARETDDSAELIREVHNALEQLRPEYRVVFVMFHEQNCAYEEISVALERPVGTIKTWLHRARAEILTCLRKRGMVDNMDFLNDTIPSKPRN